MAVRGVPDRVHNNRQRGAWALLAFLVVACGARSTARTLDWRSADVLSPRLVETSPGDADQPASKSEAMGLAAGRGQASPNPQAEGFWQPAHGPPAGIGAALGEPAPTAKAESCFSTRSPRQPGQTGVTPSRMSTSKRVPQSAHRYS
jgi:hypothetical protein